VQCKIADCASGKFSYLTAETTVPQSQPRASPMTRRSADLLVVAIHSRNEGQMTEHGLWRFSRALHRAINERRLEDIEPLIDDDVEWAIYGPVDLFPFLGARRGKPAVLEVIRQIAENVSIHRSDRETILLGGDTAASMLRFSFTSRDSNKPVAFRVAHFAGFKAGRLRSFRALLDTFDLVEQMLGQPIDLPRMASFA
jgi:hypothetical protein